MGCVAWRGVALRVCVPDSSDSRGVSYCLIRRKYAPGASCGVGIGDWSEMARVPLLALASVSCCAASRVFDRQPAAGKAAGSLVPPCQTEMLELLSLCLPHIFPEPDA